ncbi:hypothetical protein HNY73_000495 [Argiope bruennichi]|uniref:Uncharacterized protein n=1 Tax=Argiope bruennichi TaxID=94029 RepID=A0A8T0G2J5_ARGBR|nr:hypothetical protein HNY73_000495 [Argiope bruennichi]
MVEWSTLKLSASIRVVKLSFPSTATKSVWSLKSRGQPLPGLSSELMSPDLKGTNHSLHRLSLLVSDFAISPKSSVRSRNDCAGFYPFLKWHSLI